MRSSITSQAQSITSFTSSPTRCRCVLAGPRRWPPCCHRVPSASGSRVRRCGGLCPLTSGLYTTLMATHSTLRVTQPLQLPCGVHVHGRLVSTRAWNPMTSQYLLRSMTRSVTRAAMAPSIACPQRPSPGAAPTFTFTNTQTSLSTTTMPFFQLLLHAPPTLAPFLSTAIARLTSNHGPMAECPGLSLRPLTAAARRPLAAAYFAAPRAGQALLSLQLHPAVSGNFTWHGQENHLVQFRRARGLRIAEVDAEGPVRGRQWP
mmetsp:Transcript_2068/g.6152  ORF Transcript_2068/g.6152 Transcript_2068/m.6152 type:complete len:261 (-) Transcript_2068:26-808(-)